MPCHIPKSTSTSFRRRFPSNPPPLPLALLNLAHVTERAAHDYLTYATTSRDASLRLLDLRRVGPLLLCAVIWVHSKVPSLLEINLADSTGLGLHFTDCATVAMARAELQRRCAEQPGEKP